MSVSIFSLPCHTNIFTENPPHLLWKTEIAKGPRRLNPLPIADVSLHIRQARDICGSEMCVLI